MFEQVNATAVLVSWIAPEIPNGAILEYELHEEAFEEVPFQSRRRAVAIGQGAVRVFQGLATGFLETNLVGGQTYGFFVRAFTSAGFTQSNTTFYTAEIVGGMFWLRHHN